MGAASENHAFLGVKNSTDTLNVSKEGLFSPNITPSRDGRPNSPHHPSSAGSSQKDLDAPIPKELGLPSLEGGVLGR